MVQKNLIYLVASLLVFIVRGSNYESEEHLIQQQNNQENIKKNRVIVIVDSSTYQTSHSIFFKDLEKNGYEIDFGSMNSVNLRLQEYDEYLYDHMIIMATSDATGKGISQKKILDFFDAGKNVFIAGDIDSSKFFRNLYQEFGVEMDPLGSSIWDDYNTPSEISYEHNIIHTRNQEADIRSFGGQTENPILYRGSALTIPVDKNERAWGILRGQNTTYSYNFEQNEVIRVGSENVLVAAVQGRNNARVVITGSLELLSNNFYKRKEYSNRQYVSDIIQWNFNENGLLKVENIRHHKEGEDNIIPFSYKIEEQIYYFMDIYRWNVTNQEWVPYIVNDHQIMLEFTMLDPYYRLPLEKKIGSPEYSLTFKAPDKYGVFQFNVNYHRPGYTFLDVSTKVPIRPPKHNEFERYLTQAYPYYLSIFATILGLFVFLYYFLYDKDLINEHSKKNIKVE